MLEKRINGPYTVIDVKESEIDVGTALPIKESFLESFDHGDRFILFNMGGVETITSLGVGLFVNIYKKLHEKRKRLEMTNISDTLKGQLESHLLRPGSPLVDSYVSEDRAVQTLMQRSFGNYNSRNNTQLPYFLTLGLRPRKDLTVAKSHKRYFQAGVKISQPQINAVKRDFPQFHMYPDFLEIGIVPFTYSAIGYKEVIGQRLRGTGFDIHDKGNNVGQKKYDKARKPEEYIDVSAIEKDLADMIRKH